MNLLLTGVSGFIGSNLLKELEINNNKFDNIYLLTNKEILGYTCVKYFNYNLNKSIFKNIKNIDVVIHVGAYTPKSYNEKDITTACSSNISNTLSLIQSLPNLPKKFIYISTTDVYGEDTIITENSKVEPLSLYAHSKLYCEEMLKVWAEEKKVCLQILRLGHIYGVGEEKYKKIIPSIITKIIKKEDIELYSHGEELRAFLNIRDCCKLILSSLELESFVGPINVVSSRRISILNLIELIFEISQKNVKIVKTDNKIIKIRDIIYNNEKMIKCLGKEEISLIQGLKEEYEYFIKLLT
ncbi:MAG: NAD-dependent epimerase/dehydratase family protein [Clostridiaceae bacterium]